MATFKAKIIDGWRITVDKKVRRNLKLKIGDEVRVIDLVKLNHIESNPAKEA